MQMRPVLVHEMCHWHFRLYFRRVKHHYRGCGTTRWASVVNRIRTELASDVPRWRRWGGPNGAAALSGIDFLTDCPGGRSMEKDERGSDGGRAEWFDELARWRAERDRESPRTIRHGDGWRGGQRRLRTSPADGQTVVDSFRHRRTDSDRRTNRQTDRQAVISQFSVGQFSGL